MKKTIFNSFRQLFGNNNNNNNDEIAIKHQQLLSELGLIFYDWAEEYFSSKNLNKALKYSNVFDNYIIDFSYIIDFRQHNGLLTKLSFKNKIKIYCKYKGYEFNPAEHVNFHNGRIIKCDPDTRTSVEYIFIKKHR